MLGYRQRKVIIDSLLDFASEIKQKEIDRVVFKTEQLPKQLFPDISINLLKLPSSQGIVGEKSFVASR